MGVEKGRRLGSVGPYGLALRCLCAYNWWEKDFGGVFGGEKGCIFNFLMILS